MRLLYLILCSLLVGAAGCSGTNEIAGPVLHDTVYVADTARQYVTYADRVVVAENCDSVGGLDGVMVKLEGLDYVTYTDESGRFSFDHVPAGVGLYATFSRDDIFKFTQPATVSEWPVYVHRKHKYTARIDSAAKIIGDATSGYSISFYLTPLDPEGYANKSTEGYLVLSRSKDFDADDLSNAIKILKGKGVVSVDKYDFKQLNLKPGEVIYYAVSSRRSCNRGTLYDPNYPMIGEFSEIHSFLVP